ncbi:alkaline phosphatase family protein [Oryzihumus sp.]
MRRSPALVVGAVALTVIGGGAAFATASRLAGPRPDGTAVTPVGFRVTPAGDQTRLGDLPLTSALSPDGRHLLVSNDGQGTQSLQLVDAADHRVEQTIPYTSPESLYMGLAWSPDGQTAYASAAANSKVRVLHLQGGKLVEGTPLSLPTTNPAGEKVTLFPAGLAVTPDGKRLVVADQLGDAVSVIDTATGTSSTVPAGHRPLWTTVSKDGTKAFVTDQGASTVDVLDLTGGAPNVTGQVKVGLHPNRSVLSPDGRTLYVSNSDADTVSEVDVATATVRRTLSLAPYTGAPVGTTPSGLALDPTGRRLFVASSGNNDVAVVDLARGRVSGLVPTGWYPTSVAWREGHLLVTNAKGLGAGPNDGPGHPDPESSAPTSPDQYSGSMMVGTLSTLAEPTGDRLARYTAQVQRNNAADQARGAVIPRTPGGPSPIKHIIYVVKENRTYDQEMGSLGKGNGDPSLNLFGEESAPNTRELARRFTTIDNFYADAEVSAQGWNWVASATSNPYAEQQWPANYSGRKAPYPSEDADPEIAGQQPDDTYIWQRLAKKGVSFRNYGFYVDLSGSTVHAADPVLQAHTDTAYRGFDLACPDSSGTFKALSPACGPTGRVDEWVKEFQQYEAKGTLPKVEMVRLPSDHTAGTKAGSPTPKAYVADNDYALGRLVDTVSHSKDWKSTAIFVTEDDAQNGPDHVDAHRTLALAISPYTQTGRVDSTFYNTASMVRTIGLLAGVGPLTQFDAYSTPMSASFTMTPNLRAYDVRKPAYAMTTVNSASAPLAAQSGAQSLGKEDQIDENEFNKAVWASVKGAGSPMPAPQHHVIGSGAAPAGGDSDG